MIKKIKRFLKNAYNHILIRILKHRVMNLCKKYTFRFDDPECNPGNRYFSIPIDITTEEEGLSK